MIDYWKLVSANYNSDYLENSAKNKTQILEKVFDNLEHQPSKIAFLRYNPIADYLAEFYDVYVINGYHNLIRNSRIKIFSYTDNQKFDTVLGLDEHLTHYASENEQQYELEKIANLTNGWFITTLSDFKNAAPYKKYTSEVLQEFRNNSLLIEHNIPSSLDKQAWATCFYLIKNQTEMITIGPYQRRTMYFKQLAKYSSDLGCLEYVIQKQALYKGFARKNWEHIITVRF